MKTGPPRKAEGLALSRNKPLKETQQHGGGDLILAEKLSARNARLAKGGEHAASTET
jgi:hypothetical protein